MTRTIRFWLNGQATQIEIEPDMMLLDALRETLGLTGTKKGCGKGECGACTVLVNGKAVNSCIFPAMKAECADIQTVEGLSSNGALHPLQQSFIDNGAVQCGFCTPGMLMSAKALTDNNLSPTSADVREAIGGNICRCTGYTKIEKAILSVTEKPD